MADHPLPPWLDRRTALWCAELCDAMAARLLVRPGFEKRPAYLGAEVWAHCIRSLLAADERPLPRRLSLRLQKPTMTNVGNEIAVGGALDGEAAL